METTTPRRVVVGVDGSPSSRVALDRAVEEARLRRAVLVPVLAWTPPLVPAAPAEAVLVATRQECESAAGEVLDELVETLPADVEVEPRTGRGPAASVLVELSRQADLLVVGTRGRGGFVGLLLGSTSQQVISHAHCPVLVVPSPGRRRHERRAA